MFPGVSNEFQSPGGDFFDPDLFGACVYADTNKFQSPGGDFFDPDDFATEIDLQVLEEFQSPGGDFFDPDFVIEPPIIQIQRRVSVPWRGFF